MCQTIGDRSCNRTTGHRDTGGTGCTRQHSHDEGSDDLDQEAISAVHYKPKENEEVQIAWNSAVETEDAKTQEEDWKENVEIEETYEHLWPQFLDLLRYFTDMWDR